MSDRETVVVTRHQGLVDFLISEDKISEDDEVVEHASKEDVRGKNVIGVLPMYLAVEAHSITTVEINYPPEYRGEELNEEEVREYCEGMEEYFVYSKNNPVPVKIQGDDPWVKVDVEGVPYTVDIDVHGV